MIRNIKNHRVGPTAIAAVIALHSTPVTAQVAEPDGAPSTDAVESTAQPAVDPASPEPAVTVTPEPIADASSVPAAEPIAPTPAPRKTIRSTSSSALRSQTRSVPPPALSEQALPAEPVAAVPPVPQPVGPNALETPNVAVEPMTDINIPLMAGGAGAAALALLGTGIVVSRRRRRKDDMVDTSISHYDATPINEPVPEPKVERSAFAWGNAQQLATTPAKTLPSGFDVSRFGRHVQAAYGGPTPGNPSLSLKKRIKRASFFDLRERQAAARSAGRAMNPALIPA